MPLNHHDLYGDRVEGAKESVPLRPTSRLNNSRLTRYDCSTFFPIYKLLTCSWGYLGGLPGGGRGCGGGNDVWEEYQEGHKDNTILFPSFKMFCPNLAANGRQNKFYPYFNPFSCNWFHQNQKQNYQSVCNIYIA
jgi:hypothetical protein